MPLFIPKNFHGAKSGSIPRWLQCRQEAQHDRRQGNQGEIEPLQVRWELIKVVHILREHIHL
jgi:hypothetical protein